jgi:hypothetical protein
MSLVKPEGDATDFTVESKDLKPADGTKVIKIELTDNDGGIKKPEDLKITMCKGKAEQKADTKKPLDCEADSSVTGVLGTTTVFLFFPDAGEGNSWYVNASADETDDKKNMNYINIESKDF